MLSDEQQEITVPSQMWFGNEQKMQWVPCPRTGMGVNTVGYASQVTYQNGRAGVYRTNQTHKEFNLEFPVQDASGASGLDVFSRFASGLYGDCKSYPLFFADPMNYDQNLFPPGWSAPGLFERGWANVVADTVTEFRNLAINPSVEVDSVGYSSVAGTSGTAAGARTSTGPHLSGSWSYRVTWSVANTVVEGGTTYAGTLVSAGVTYDFFQYVMSNKIQRVALTIRFKNSGGGTVSTVQSTHTVLAANTLTKIEIADVVVPAGAVSADLEMRSVVGTSGTVWAIGDWIQVDAAMVAFSSNSSPTYFDGSSAGAIWTGTAHASSSYMYVGRSTPTMSNTATNTFSVPTRQATWTILTPANAYPTVNNDFGEIPYALIPIPPGYTLHMGATGSTTGTAELRVHLFNSPGNPASPAATADLTLLSATSSTRLNASWSGSSYQYAKVFITRTSTATSTITLSSMMAQLWPTGFSPTLTGQFIFGQGHRGLKFVDSAVAEEYVMTNGHLKGLSTTLVEAQDRG